MERNIVAEKLRKARKAAGLTQKELGNLMGVTRQAITRIESGNQGLTVETLLTVAQALKFDLMIELRQKKKI